MKTLITTALIVCLFASCSTSKITVKREYLSLIEIKYEYELSNADLRKIVSAAKNDSLKLIYHGGRDQWMYDAAIDYSKYKSIK